MTKTCTHISQMRQVTPSSTGCEECLKTGDQWVSLRLCLICGHVGCCNNSKNKHAQKHFQVTAHPIVQAFKEDLNWKWCYIDKTYVGKRPNPMKIINHIIKGKVNKIVHKRIKA